MAGSARGDRRRAEAPEEPGVADPDPDRQRINAQRAHLSRRDLQDASPRAARAESDRSAPASRGGLPGYLDARRRAVQDDLSVQGVRIYRPAAVPLAVLLLPQPRGGA